MKAVMKSVMKAVSPEICEKLLSGDCKILISKTAPKCEVPFKGYIYCTKAKEDKYILEWHDYETGKISRIDGKVIGEFICNEIDSLQKRGIDNNFDYCYLSLNEWGNDDIAVEITDIKKSRIPKADLNKYGANVQWLYAWHISDLKIYDKPKELGEFYKCGAETFEELSDIDRLCKYCYETDYGEHSYSSSPNGMICCEGRWCDEAYEAYLEENFALTRAPSGWQYVEEL